MLCFDTQEILKYNSSEEMASMNGIDISNYFYISDNAYPIDKEQWKGIDNGELIIFVAKRDYLSIFNDYFVISYKNLLNITMNDQMRSISEGINKARKQFLTYYEENIQKCVLDNIPKDIICIEDDEERLIQITKWFKECCFRFLWEPMCLTCKEKTTRLSITEPNDEESVHSCSRTEIFECAKCKSIIRFPRYNSVPKLFETKVGRCGEFANAFTCCLIAMGYDARYVRDWTDHCWTEVWSKTKERYIAIDPCENTIDTPLMYEIGWKKKLTWIVSIGKYSCSEVTPRYTINYEDIITRRSKDVNEEWFRRIIEFKNYMWQKDCPNDLLEILNKKEIRDRQSIVIARTETKPEELRDRISGSK